VQVARLAWCHGKAYAAPAYSRATNAAITEITFDSNYEVLETRKLLDIPEPIPCCKGCHRCAWAILGLACDPREGEDGWRLYFSLSKIYQNDGLTATTFQPYNGEVRRPKSRRHDA
jgi:hypothetical protein